MIKGVQVKEMGFGIIEDCGGVMGLEDIREAFKIKKAKTMKCILIG